MNQDIGTEMKAEVRKYQLKISRFRILFLANKYQSNHRSFPNVKRTLQ